LWAYSIKEINMATKKPKRLVSLTDTTFPLAQADQARLLGKLEDELTVLEGARDALAERSELELAAQYDVLAEGANADWLRVSNNDNLWAYLVNQGRCLHDLYSTVVELREELASLRKELADARPVRRVVRGVK
jgi:hypothetical protein